MRLPDGGALQFGALQFGAQKPTPVLSRIFVKGTLSGVPAGERLEQDATG